MSKDMLKHNERTKKQLLEEYVYGRDSIDVTGIDGMVHW